MNLYLYPSLNDPLFTKKISEREEFNNTKYDGKIYDIEKQANKLCNAEFEISPHQQFIKNFLSSSTPYNSLLLFHGLGSGKTCSAIGVAEEMRDYSKQLGNSNRIIVIASPNVQKNFELQLFDENKLQLIDGLWNINSCVGNKLLKEINPLSMRGLSKEKVISQIKSLINNSYWFLGYTEFANQIQKKSDVSSDLIINKKETMKNKLNKHFGNRLIIIDEVHNIRLTDDNKNKKIGLELFKLIENVNTIKLLFLSATPLYNSYKELIWIINIMNLNDKRSQIETLEIFTQEGNLKVLEDGTQIGKEILERKSIGYISFVRGNNPYTFPYRIWPDMFAPTKTLKEKIYPRTQLNSKDIINPIEFLSLYLVDIDGYQNNGYNYIINSLSEREELSIQDMDQLGYIQLQRPIEALNIVYPNEKLFEDELEADINIADIVGKGGLNKTMTYTVTSKPAAKTNFEYRPEILENYGRIFAPDNINIYSAKIKAITENILNSEGVILIYSQYLDGGIIPIALALEEIGITRYGNNSSLFSKPPIENLDLTDYKNKNTKDSIPAKYIIISGDPNLSPNNTQELIAATKKSNINGNDVKVVLISQAGSEGLDFKFIRQVHILEPWYNLSRIEQIIGRAVRNCSHKDLPFIERNVQIFLYGSLLVDESEEAADLYIYRLAEYKAKQIGEITRLLKQVAIDCLLNKEQQNFSQESMNITVDQKLSNNEIIKYKIGDKPFSAQCDFQDTCMYKCKPSETIGEPMITSQSGNFIDMNSDKIIYRIKQLMKEKYFYSRDELIRSINIVREYPLVQIYSALTYLISDNSENITDKYGRFGRLVNIGDLYLFQPIELTNKNLTLFERKVPIPFKRDKIPINISEVVSPSEDKELLISPVVDKLLESSDIKETTEKLDKTLKESKQIVKDQKVPLELSPKFESGKVISQQLEKDYNISNSHQVIVRGEKDTWYKFSSIIISDLIKKGIQDNILDELLISHILETILFEDTFNLLNYLYKNNSLNIFEKKLKNYYDSNIISNNSITGLQVIGWDSKIKKPIPKLLIFNKEWTLAQPEDWKDLMPIIKSKVVALKDLAKFSGFMGNFKNILMVFKVRENKPGNSGARCDQGSKVTAEKLNNIIGNNEFLESNLKKISSTQLCVLEEYLLRLNDYNKVNGKRWFLNPSEAVILNESK